MMKTKRIVGSHPGCMCLIRQVSERMYAVLRMYVAGNRVGTLRSSLFSPGFMRESRAECPRSDCEIFGFLDFHVLIFPQIPVR